MILKTNSINTVGCSQITQSKQYFLFISCKKYVTFRDSSLLKVICEHTTQTVLELSTVRAETSVRKGCSDDKSGLMSQRTMKFIARQEKRADARSLSDNVTFAVAIRYA